MSDPFKSHHSLDIDYDTSYEQTEAWQDALKNDGSTAVATERRAKVSRVKFFYFVTLGVLLLLGGRLMTLQILNSGQNRALAEVNRIREASIPAARGVVYDTKRQIIARNEANFEVLVTPSELPRKPEERQALYATLASVLKKSPPELQTTAESKGLRYGQPILLADQIDRDTSILVRVRTANLPGIHTQDNPQRRYERPEEFAHLLGYTGRVSDDDLKKHPELSQADFVGKTGLEAVYNGVLSGQTGKRRVEVNAAGQSVKELQSTDPVPGKNLVLSVDADLQHVMADSVSKEIAASQRHATGGSAIALNPKNGEVLGMVSLPSFDNNKFVSGIDQTSYKALAENPDKPLFNRPIAGEYPPGSTFKIVTATAGLGEGVVTPSTYLSSPPELVLDGFKFPDWNPRGHGNLTIEGALAESSDVFFYKVAGGLNDQKGVGEDKMAAYMRQYNLGALSGIDLPDEHTGLVPTPKYKQDTFHEPWYIGDTYHMGIGQGFVLTTPLQVADWTAAIAGGGIAYKPHLVKAIENADNPADAHVVKPEQLINLKTNTSVAQTIKEGMRQAVASPSGTSVGLKDLPMSVCGKTGSAEFANETRSHGWFTAFAPCDDPQIVVTVMIEGGGEGADVALPAAKSILQQFFHLPVTAVANPKEAGAAGRIKASD